MKRAIFTSKNLIGDTMYLSAALRVWHQQHPDWEIDFVTLNDHVTKLYEGMGVPIRRIYFINPMNVSDFTPYDFEHTFDVNKAFVVSDEKQQHIAESYADLLGVELDRKEDRSHLGPFYEPPQDAVVSGRDYSENILVSMFSASCSSRGTPPGPPNKMLPWGKWKTILKVVRRTFPQIPVWFLGAPTDVIPPEFDLLSLIPGGGYLTGVPLDGLAHIMRSCKFVVTLDNGMAHLAASQKAREFVFYPRALGQHYILPFGNPNMRFMHMDPNTLNPVEAVWHLQEAWKAWGLV